MSREIKFRAYTFGEGLKKSMCRVKKIDFSDGEITCEHDYKFKFGEFKLMQYTGLKDKHGKEIYEGDIVKAETIMESFPVWIGEVMRECDYIGIDKNEGAEWVIVDRKLGSYIGFYPGQKQKREVIGNIFENKELLK